MKLHNTLTRKVEEFTPINDKRVKIYTCGPTVYSFAHIGNFTCYVYWDLLVRTLQLEGWPVDRVLNITDVGHLTSDADDGEDKMEKGAKREGKTVWEVAEMYMGDFLENFHALNMVEPTDICRATDFIKEDTQLVDALYEKGYLYDTTDGLYFDTSKFPKYADFARLDLEHLKAGARIEFSDEKRNPSDFAVWKWIRDGEDHAMQWEYRGRMGYPGWHLECSTIIHEKLGEPIDIHCGGIDHIPVHHTNEIAQTECAYGEKMANFWLHNNFITIEGQKISKSLGNVYMFSDLKEKGYSHMDYKMWVLQGHFQSERNFSFEDIAAAKQRLLNYRNFAALRWQKEATDMSEVCKAMMMQLENNLNSAGALAELDKSMSTNVPDEEFVKFLDDAFGLKIAESTPDISDELKTKIEKRFKAKKEKDFATADALRDEISDEGIALLDGADGSIWQYAE
ncbi:MAG: cysteine--tRNA ligase [Candidatus Saccharibacteria bacterium]|nr:cysteine--tRNA ligase [Candidatus Saccharibacteria bacterium]